MKRYQAIMTAFVVVNTINVVLSVFIISNYDYLEILFQECLEFSTFATICFFFRQRNFEKECDFFVFVPPAENSATNDLQEEQEAQLQLNHLNNNSFFYKNRLGVQVENVIIGIQFPSQSNSTDNLKLGTLSK